MVAQRSVRVAKATCRLEQLVRISKEKMRFAKAGEQNFSTAIFKVAEVLNRRPRAVNELADLNATPMDDQFYRVELTPVRITDRTTYKILDKRVRRGIPEYLVRKRRYRHEFDSWVPEASVKNI